MNWRSTVWRTLAVVGALAAVALSVSLLVFFLLPRSVEPPTTVISSASPELPTTHKNSTEMSSLKVAANPAYFPYQVFLDITEGIAEKKSSCGAAIIHPNFLLSAASCFGSDGETFYLSHIRVIAGVHDLKAFDGTEQIRNVTRLTLHENYNTQTFDNDIALLQLNAPLNFDVKHVDAVQIRDSNVARLPGKRGLQLF